MYSTLLPLPAELAFAGDLMSGLFVLRVCKVIATVIVLYDQLITIDREVEFVWMKRWSFSTFLFIINRYMGAVVMIIGFFVLFEEEPSASVSDVGFKFISWAATGLIFNTQIILQFRIYALYKESRKVLIFLATAFVIEIAITWWILGVMDAAMEVNSEPLPGISICTGSNSSGMYAVLWVPIVVFEVILFLLALFMFVQHVKQARLRNVRHKYSLLTAVLVGNLAYFLLAVVADAITAILWLTLDGEWFEIPAAFTLAFTIILGCRLILDLRQQYDRSSAARNSEWGSEWLDSSPRVDLAWSVVSGMRSDSDSISLRRFGPN